MTAELREWKNWKTEKPTDENARYRVLWIDKDTREVFEEELLWHDQLKCWYDEQAFGLWAHEYQAEIIAWQKIEPNKEASK